MQEIRKALNLYMLDNNRYPENLDKLELAYPNGVPKDPFTKQPYKYEIDGQGFTLICLGKDEVVGGDEPDEKDIIVNEVGLVKDD